MPWWGWVLIVIGVMVIGATKIAVFKRMRSRKSSGKRFPDEE